MAASLASGNYLPVLQSEAASTILRAADPEELETTKADSLPSLVSMLRWRVSRYVLHTEGDAYLDDPSAADTLVCYRAAAALFVAAAAVNAYVQANYTGPEFSADETARFHPLPYARSLLGMADPSPAATSEWHQPGASELRRAVPGLGSGGSSSSSREGPEDAAAAGAGEADVAIPPSAAGEDVRSPVVAASLAALQVGGDEAYEHICCPHWLVTGRALLAALLGPGDTSLAGEQAHGRGALASEPRPPPGSPAAEAEARYGKLFAAGRRLASCSVWAARAAVLHQRSLVEREPSLTLWREAAFHFRAAARAHCPGYLPAFGTGDAFLRHFVAQEFAATAAVGVDRHALSGGDHSGREEGSRDHHAPAAALPPEVASATPASAGPAAASSPSASPHSSPEVVARLLLEWGLAQHYFGRTAAAKTSFFLARRETGLVTRLTGALGRRTKFQTFDIAQLVLQAASTGTQAAAAVADAARAEALGAAPGRFSAQALREAGTVLPACELSASAGSGSGAAAAGDMAPAPTGEEAVPSASASGVKEGEGEGGGAVLLGGVRSVRLDDIDADNVLLETVALRPDALAGVETEGDRQRERDVYERIGWGKELQKRLAAKAAEQLQLQQQIDSSAGRGDDDGAAGAVGSAPTPSRGDDDDDDPSTLPPVAEGPLSALDQAIVLALCLDIRNHNPADGLTCEEMRPYVDRALDTPLNWMVYSTGLLVRSALEFESHRTAERAALQLQALVDQHTHRLTPLQASQRVIDASAPAGHRMAFIFCTPFPPRWELQRQCADRYRKLGVLRSALALYEALETWDDVIDVCVLLDKRARAEALVRARLAVRPTPRLLCVLGVVTDSDEPVVRAWEESGRTYARAQLLLARRRAGRGRRAEAVAALATGLKLAPPGGSDWFLLGSLCMALEKLPTAAEAFTKCVQLDPANANAWANLGSIYLHTHQWAKGYTALEQAQRIDRTDWRMSSNFLVAAIRTRNYSRAITTMHKLLDVRHSDERNQGVDLPALGVLTHAVLGSMRRQAQEELAVAEEAGAGGTAGCAAAPAARPADDGSDSVLPAIPESLDVVVVDDDDVDGEASSGTGSGGPSSSPPPPAENLLDADGNPAAIYLEPLTKLFEHITGSITKEPKVWQLFAQVRDARGEADEALECRARVCRALQTANWEKQEAAVVPLCRASRVLVIEYLQAGGARNLLQARMHLQSVIAKVESGRLFGDHAEVVQLRSVLAEVQEREAAARQAATPGETPPVPPSRPTRAFHTSA